MRGKKIALLNMGDYRRFGGGWDVGNGGLESEIFMRTNISTSLGTLSQRPGPFESVYTSDVTLLRSGMDEGYRFLDGMERMKLDVVTTYAYDNRVPYTYQGISLDPDMHKEAAGWDDQSKFIYLIAFNKISNVLSACVSNEVKTVILGALGCGNFKNPPYVVAAAFCSAINNFRGIFDNIYISLIDVNVRSIFAQRMIFSFPSACLLGEDSKVYWLDPNHKSDN